MGWREEIVRKAEEFVESAMAGRDASHDAAHAYRVRDLALSLAKEEGLNDPSSPNYSPDGLLVVELAALLHDIGDYKYAKDNQEDTSAVLRFLEEACIQDNQKDKILTIIQDMGFKNEVAGKLSCQSHLELKVVQDADRLDAIGAIGIARCFAYGGSKRHMLHDPRILPRSDLSKEEYMSKSRKQTSINHFHEKLLNLKGLMKTTAGQRRAEKRHKFMEDFVSEFYEEWDSTS